MDASNGRLNQARAPGIATDGQLEESMARMGRARRTNAPRSCRVGAEMAGDGLPNQHAQLLVTQLGQFGNSLVRVSRLTGRPTLPLEIDSVDDAHDRGIDRRGLGADGLAGGASLEHHKHRLAHSCTGGIDCQERRSTRCIVRIDRLNEEQLGAVEAAILLCGNNRADDFCNLHGEQPGEARS